MYAANLLSVRSRASPNLNCRENVSICVIISSITHGFLLSWKNFSELILTFDIYADCGERVVRLPNKRTLANKQGQCLYFLRIYYERQDPDHIRTR